MKKQLYLILFLLVTLMPSAPLRGETPFEPFGEVTKTIGYYLTPGQKKFTPAFENRAALMKQVGKSLQLSKSYTVAYEDVLGEGSGAWDSDRRFPEHEVNCIIWLQVLLSDIYGNGLKDQTPVLDKIRYYGGHAGYGLRKHFIGRWLALDPGPLKRLDFSEYAAPVKTIKHSITLNLETFRKSMRFPGRMYRQDINKINLEYIAVKDFPKLAVLLEEGYYIMFAVPSDFYLRAWTKLSGPLGLVHAFVLQVDGKGPGKNRKPGAAVNSPLNIRSYHASILSGTVVSMTLPRLVKRVSKTARGFVLYQLDPNWDYLKTEPLDLEALALLVEESKLKPSVEMGTSFPEAGRNRIPKAVKDRIAKQRAMRKEKGKKTKKEKLEKGG